MKEHDDHGKWDDEAAVRHVGECEVHEVAVRMVLV